MACRVQVRQWTHVNGKHSGWAFGNVEVTNYKHNRATRLPAVFIASSAWLCDRGLSGQAATPQDH